MIRAGASALTLAVMLGAACTPIEPVPLTNAPVNTCPCEGYAEPDRPAPRCRNGRCEIPTPANRPNHPFFIVVDVPTSSSYAPGETFVFYSNQVGSPAFTPESPRPGVVPKCVRPTCLRLGEMTTATGTYRVSASLSLRAGFPLEDRAAIPVRVMYDPVGNAQFPTEIAAVTPETAALFSGLPLSPTFTFPYLVNPEGLPPFPVFAQPLPSGTYLRVLYPDPPFDELFPPRADAVQVVTTTFVDDFFLNDDPATGNLDEPTSRVVDVEREAGLDGWRVWVADHASGRRISTVKTLSGRSARAQLDTSGERRDPGGGLGDDVDLVLEPPASSIAVPRYVSPVFSGGLATIRYDRVPPPVRVEGNVAEPGAADAPLLGYPARVSFQSTTITALADPPTTSLLSYATAVNTDERGRFATVLPPGSYNVVVEPAEGTGFSKYQQSVIVQSTITSAALQLRPEPRTRVTGRVVLTDGRPVAEAEILATPLAPTTPLTPKPRPGRTTTGPDGRFLALLDPGPYVLTVAPKRGSGFPRVITRPQIPAGEADLSDIRVPAPSPLTFTLRDPTPVVERIVPNALVRVFAVPGVTQGAVLEDATPDAAPVEIGRAVSDAKGQVEILLAPGPR